MSIDDPWIAANSPIPAEKLHALGVITFRWNQCEIGLFMLLTYFSGAPWRVAWAIGHEMGDVALSKAIGNLLSTSEWQPRIKDHMRDTLGLYDINRLNRNQLTHFTASAGREKVEFLRTRGPVFAPEPIPNDIEVIRRVAEEIGALTQHLAATLNWLLRLTHPRSPMSVLEDLEAPLPPLPPMPERVWTPPPADPKGKKRVN